MNKNDINLKDLIRIFDTYNRSDGKSPYTLRWYNEVLNLFLHWLVETSQLVNLGAISENTVREFIIWLKERQVNGHEIKVYTVNNRVRALRAFFNWLYRKEYAATHLLQDFKPPRLPQVMVDTLSNEEIAIIMTNLIPSTATGSRNIAILALLLDSGLRLAELVGLKINDLYLEEHYVKVMGKGSKERMVAFGSTAKNALLNYMMHFRGEPAHPGIEEFFLNIEGYAMSGGAVRSMLKRLGVATGIPRLHAHLCRHTYATNFLINGGNVLLLKQNLGHTTLVMVDRYVHLATSKATVLSRSFSPLDRLNIRRLRRGSNGRKSS